MELTPSPSLHAFNIEGIRRRYEQYPDNFKLELKYLILQLLEETSVACNVFDYFTRFDYKTHLYKETHVNNIMSLPTSKLDELFE
jgi:galactose-1-phosphate uridylyltransferase